MEKKNIIEVTGLKGICALIVMISHYTLAFYPAIWNAQYELEHITNIEKIIHRTPLYTFFNGSLMVNIFFCISGFLLFQGYREYGTNSLLQKRIVNRYFKLVGPVFFSILLTCFMMKLDLFYNVEVATISWSDWIGGFFCFNPTWSDAIRNGLVEVFFYGNSLYNPILWTLNIELYGITSVTFILMLWGKSKQRGKVYLMFIVLILLINHSLFAFMIGVIIGEIYHSEYKLGKNKTIILLGIGIAIGNFLPIWAIIPPELNLGGKIKIDLGEVVRSLSAGCILCAIVCASQPITMFKSKILQWLGKYSMYIFVNHFWILCSVGCYLLTFFWKITEGNYNLSAFLAIIISFVLTGFTVVYIKKLLDNSINKITTRCAKIFIDEKEEY